MSKIINISKHKTDKKSKLILQDLEEINKIMALSLRALGMYKKYTPVRRSIAEVADNKLTIEIYIKKIKEELKANG